MTGVAIIFKCKKCEYEIRSDWNFCPMCGDAIVCHKTMDKSAKSPTSTKSAKKTAKK
jgi:RNA polymerase subunit RPABC4/transcription elongation factor Spt4